MHPILFHFELFGRTIHIYSWGTMLSISFALGIIIMLNLSKRDGYAKTLSLNTLIIAIIGALIGARLLYVFTNFSDYSDGFPMSIFDMKKRDGMVAYGGYLGGIFAAWGYAHIKKWRFLRYADNAAPLLGLGLGFTRIGCTLAGCDYGKPTDLFFGIRFPVGSFAYKRHLREGLIAATADKSLPVWPTQPMESLTGFILFGVLLWFHLRKRKYAGQTLALFFILYGVARFFFEFVRGDAGRGALISVSTSQWIGLITVVFGIWVLFKKFSLEPEKILVSQMAEEKKKLKSSKEKSVIKKKNDR